MNRGLKITFAINTFLTFMAFVLLVIKPQLLASAVGIHVSPDSYFEGYMLGAAEWGLAAITFFGRKITAIQALRVISIAGIVFHLSSAAVELYTVVTGGSTFLIGIWANITVRIILASMFGYFGLYLTSKEKYKS